MNYTEALIKARKARIEAKQATDLYKAQIADIRPRIEALEQERRGTSPRHDSTPINEGITVRDGKVWRR
jgi:hypothetical protein